MLSVVRTRYSPVPLSSEQEQTLFSLLEQSGWAWRDHSIHAPNDAMWLNRDTPWVEDITDFYNRICGRRARIVHNHRGETDVERAVSVTASLIAALKTMQFD